MITFLLIYFIIPILILGIEIYIEGGVKNYCAGSKKIVLFLETLIFIIFWPIVIIYLIIALYKNT